MTGRRSACWPTARVAALRVRAAAGAGHETGLAAAVTGALLATYQGFPVHMPGQVFKDLHVVSERLPPAEHPRRHAAHAGVQAEHRSGQRLAGPVRQSFPPGRDVQRAALQSAWLA